MEVGFGVTETPLIYIVRSVPCVFPFNCNSFQDISEKPLLTSVCSADFPFRPYLIVKQLGLYTPLI
jgi:hypothetical protein